MSDQIDFSNWTKQDIIENAKKAYAQALSSMRQTTENKRYPEYTFYLFLISQCKTVFNPSLPSTAAVGFHNNQYVLYLNPLPVLGKNTKTKELIYGFNLLLPLEHRLGILKHEMCHVSYGHLINYIRAKTENVTLETEEETAPIIYKPSEQFGYNLAMDCALNQDINRKHLPEGVIYPDNIAPVTSTPEWEKTTLYYYGLLDKKQMEQDGSSNKQGQNSVSVDGQGESDQNSGSGQGTSQEQSEDADQSGQGSGGESEKEPDNSVDGSKGIYGKDDFESPLTNNNGIDHSTWDEVQGSADIVKDITANIVKKAGDETIKNKGTLPANYGELIENLSDKGEVDWRQVLRRITGNTKANSKKTLLRRDRRLPMARYIKGRTKDRIFELAVVSDVSGSVCDKALVKLWTEILSVINTFKVNVTLVQVDSEPSEPEILTTKTKTIERKACGGTILYPAVEKLYENKIKFDALIVTTDNYLYYEDVVDFRQIKKPVIWLVENEGKDAFPEQTQGNHKYIKLKDNY